MRTVLSILFVCYAFHSASSQAVDGRLIRPPCDTGRQPGCPRSEDRKKYETSADKYEALGDPRRPSIDGGGVVRSPSGNREENPPNRSPPNDRKYHPSETPSDRPIYKPKEEAVESPDRRSSRRYNVRPDDITEPIRTGSEKYNSKPEYEASKPIEGDEISKPFDDRRSPIPEDRPARRRDGSQPRPVSGDARQSYGRHGYPDEDHDSEYMDGSPEGDVERMVGDCICVPYYQCQDGHIVTDGAGIIDARRRPQHPNEKPPLDGKLPPLPPCGPFHVCCSRPESSTVRPYEHKCGVRNPSGINSRILSPSNKGEADFGEWPWQAAILKAEGKVNIFQCGGVLIDKLHVLTVAHCVFHLHQYNEYPLKVRLGEWDTQTTAEFLAHEDYKVSKIIVHPEYRNTSLWNDLALLRLEEAVLFAPHIDTICLPKYDELFVEQNCVVTGWGKDAYNGGTFSNIMKEVALQVIDNFKCEEMLRKTRLGRFFELYEGFLCAGGEYGLDSCKGDGGGPLVCYRKDKSYALAGIVSWGIDCGQPGVPGVYVKIQKYLDFISESTGTPLNEYWPKHR